MQRRLLIAAVCVVVFSLGLVTSGACQEEAPNLDVGGDFARAVSNSLYPVLGLSVGYHLLSNDAHKVETGRRVADAILLAGGATQLLKTCINSERPYPHVPNDHGMPSGHAALSFAMAASLSEREPELAVPAYFAAAMISWSRYQTKQHYWDQILVGAALGTYLGRKAGRGEWNLWGHEESSSLRFAPFAGPNAGSLPDGACCVLYQTSF